MFIIPDRGWKFTTYFFSFLMFLFLFRSCEKSTLPVLSGQVRLVAEEVGVTEAWLRVQTEKISGEFSLTLWRDDTCIFQGVFRQADTTLYDSTLLPAHRYIYRASLKRVGHPVLESAPLEITTMDTTSHKFQWEVIEIPSPYGSGALYDVAIIDENDPSGGASRTGIWAVGAIFADSAQPWLPYNAVHLSVGQAGWDGQSWELKRITYGGSPWPIKTIWSFTPNNIWFDAFVRWNGSTFVEIYIPNILIGFGIKKMWGTSSSDFYIVGNSGLITHYDGQSWQRIESGTELPIQDIWGAKNEKSGEYEVYCIASTKYFGGESRIMKIENNEVVELSNEGLPWSISGIWFKSPYGYYVVGDGIFYTPKINQQSEWIELVADITRYYTHAIRGNDINDIFVVGAYNTVIHFNGMTWKNYSGSEILNSGFHLHRLDYRDDIVAAVGYLGGEGIVLTGKRIE